jgi:glycosyltransferase involved in cell wall biosynthesis
VKIYWYWPHRHASSSALCRATLRPGDQLTVHALTSSSGEALPLIDEYEVVRDLPDPAAPAANAIARATRRPRVALGRSTARAQLLRRGFDVAHIGNVFYQTDCLDLRRLRGRVRLVCDIHDVRPHRRMLPSAVETTLLRATYHNAHQLVVLHDVLKEEIVTDFGVDPARVHVVPVVLDPTVQVDRSCRADEPPTMLFFGALRANKGLEVLTDAVTQLVRKLDAHVVIAGAGDAEVTAYLERHLGGLPNVTLELGFIAPTRKHELFSGASWALLPYTSFHSQSAVLADAYAYRLPVIVSDVGAIGPTVHDDGTGFVVAPGSVDELAEAMLQASQCDPRAFDRALDDAAARHDVTVVGARLREIWEIAAAERAS